MSSHGPPDVGLTHVIMDIRRPNLPRGFIDQRKNLLSDGTALAFRYNIQHPTGNKSYSPGLIP